VLGDGIDVRSVDAHGEDENGLVKDNGATKVLHAIGRALDKSINGKLTPLNNASWQAA